VINSMDEPRYDAHGMTDIQPSDTIAAFIARWKPSGGRELANCQSFMIELYALLGVTPHSHAHSDPSQRPYSPTPDFSN